MLFFPKLFVFCSTKVPQHTLKRKNSILECLRKRILVGKFLSEKKTETENGPRFDTTKIMLRKFIFVVFLSYLGHHWKCNYVITTENCNDKSTSDVIVLLQQIIVSLAVDQYSHSTPIMLKDESSTAER